MRVPLTPVHALPFPVTEQEAAFVVFQERVAVPPFLTNFGATEIEPERGSGSHVLEPGTHIN